MTEDMRRGVMNLLGTIAVIVVNALATTIPVGGLTTGQISDKFPVLFVPAGYVFSIWGLIYLALVAFSIYGLLPAGQRDPSVRRIGYLYLLTCVANIVWIFLWQYQVFAPTIVVMLVLLGALIAIYLRLGIGRRPATAATRWLVRVPFSIYLGWITVATIANATTELYWAGWRGGPISEPAWAVIMLVAGALIAAIMAFTRADVAYVLVIIWAYAGIAVKQAATTVVAVPAIILALVVLAVLVVGLVRRRPFRAAPLTTS